MNYSFFLFSKLYDIHIEINYEYDYMFEDLTDLYKDYDESNYNDPNEDEYTCMQNFFLKNRAEIIKRFVGLSETSFFKHRPELNP